MTHGVDMKVWDRLVEWDHLELRIRGPKLERMIADLIRMRKVPVSDFHLEFRAGKILVYVNVQKGISIPVTFSVSRIAVAGNKVKLPLHDVATFGILPIPKILFRLIRSLSLSDGVSVDTGTLTVTVLLDRFVPDFIELNLQSIRIVPDGLVVQVGSGGADIALPMQEKSRGRDDS